MSKMVCWWFHGNIFLLHNSVSFFCSSDTSIYFSRQEHELCLDKQFSLCCVSSAPKNVNIIMDTAENDMIIMMHEIRFRKKTFFCFLKSCISFFLARGRRKKTFRSQRIFYGEHCRAKDMHNRKIVRLANLKKIQERVCYQRSLTLWTHTQNGGGEKARG